MTKRKMGPTVQVEVRWQKNAYMVDVALDAPPAVFKSQLFSLTGVPPERQKVMGVKGGLLKDDGDWAALGLKPGQRLTMLGTADAAPEAPAAAPAFVEDLPEEEQDATGLSKFGAGLQNLGNTCYMNSTLQCLYAVPELRLALADPARLAPGGGADPAAALAAAVRGLFGSLTRSAAPVPPLEVLLALRAAFPQFAQQGRDGSYMQQDAEECWSALLGALRARLREPPAAGGGAAAAPGGAAASTVAELFGVRTVARLRAAAAPAEPEVVVREETLMLKCNITGEVNHLAEGLRLGLAADREQAAPSLGGAPALFAGAAAIERLPPYLAVQMVRFFYKADVQQKAKILRRVAFPLVLDAYEFCGDGLKAALDAPRAAAKAAEDAAAAAAKAAPKAAGAGGAPARPHEPPAPPGAPQGALTGKYELAAVLTHKGRSADSGHYVAWARVADGSWVQFDDDAMVPRREDEVAALAGGGDWHMAYLLLYRARRAPAEADGAAPAGGAAPAEGAAPAGGEAEGAAPAAAAGAGGQA